MRGEMKYCAHCGKEVLDAAVICLNCGCRVTPSYTPPVVQETAVSNESFSATAAFWCGIVSFFVGWLVLGVTAIVLACISRGETGGVMSAQAKVGLVCGSITGTLSVLLIVFFVLLII